jgi:hypothetical protein
VPIPFERGLLITLLLIAIIPEKIARENAKSRDEFSELRSGHGGKNQSHLWTAGPIPQISPHRKHHGDSGETDDFRGGFPDTRHEDRHESGCGEWLVHPRDWVQGDLAHLSRRPL